MTLDVLGIVFPLFFLVPFVLIVGALVWFAARLAIRVAGRAIFGDAQLLTDDEVVRGGRLGLRLVATPKRSVLPTSVEWELVGEEVAILRGATRNTTHRNTFERLTAESPSQGEWRADIPIELSAEIAVPPRVPTSFSTANHTIKWSAVARVRIPGQLDLELSQPVDVVAATAAPAQSSMRTQQALEQGPLIAELTLDLPNEGGVPVVRSGDRLVGSLRLSTREDLAAGLASLRLVRLLHGSGTAEESVHDEIPLHAGDLAAGQSTSTEIHWTLPPTKEVSFEGRHVKCDWMLDVKVDRPMWMDLHLRFPITVV